MTPTGRIARQPAPSSRTPALPVPYPSIARIVSRQAPRLPSARCTISTRPSPESCFAKHRVPSHADTM
ncbi:hypothetical protein B0H17DRAFT_1059113 [Mycena rosella]|uniref:Uncharacterized protein n=1 Tax=Mycena rosella TaxID=1033263 RepID=A0AAD7DKT7_MYCRO|nr:hypothetical protein B0H17DRAFT_1059113 [Mycena rosella]